VLNVRNGTKLPAINKDLEDEMNYWKRALGHDPIKCALRSAITFIDGSFMQQTTLLCNMDNTILIICNNYSRNFTGKNKCEE
jgi:hypothetical protein